MHKQLAIQTIRWIVASVTFFVGIVDLILGPDRIDYPTYVGLLHLSSALDSLVLALLFYASIGLIIGRRRAWYAALAVLAISAVWMTIESRMFLSPLSLVAVASMGIVAITKRYYPVASGSIRAIKPHAGPLVFVGITTVGALLLVLVRDPFHLHHQSFYRIVTFTLETMFTASGVLGARAHSEHGGLLVFLSVLGALNYGAIALLLLKPVSDYFTRTPTVQRRVRAILELYGTSSEDYFKYFPFDKSYFFATTFQGFIAYGVQDGVCIALADPIARDADQKRHLITEFLAFCRTNGWQPAFLPVSPDNLTLYAWSGLKRIKIGENAVIPIPQYVGRPLQKNMRNIVNRFGNANYRAAFVDPTDTRVIRQLRGVSDSWLAHRNHKEHAFVMAHFDEDYMRECRVFALLNDGGTIVAYVNQQPNYSVTRQASIDMIRSRSDARPNTMDMLLHQLILELHKTGWQTLDLGLAPLSGLHGTRKMTERGLHVLYRHANWRYSFVGLRRFKNKFEPDWSSRYLLYNGPATRIPAIARAIAALLKFNG